MSDMEEATKGTLMVLYMKDIGQTIKLMGEEELCRSMVTFMKATGLMTRQKGVELTHILMARNMWVTGRMTNNMVLVKRGG